MSAPAPASAPHPFLGLHLAHALAMETNNDLTIVVQSLTMEATEKDIAAARFALGVIVARGDEVMRRCRRQGVRQTGTVATLLSNQLL